MINAITALVLVSLLTTFVFGVLALLVFWHLAMHRPAKRLSARIGTVVVGLATITSAVIAVASYLGL